MVNVKLHYYYIINYIITFNN